MAPIPRHKTGLCETRLCVLGMTYVWYVELIKNDEAVMEQMPNVPPGRFRVLESDRQEQIKKLRLVSHTRPEAHFVLGVLLAHSGVLDDAVIEFQAVPRSDQNYVLAQKFVRDLKYLSAQAH
jgi:hypothetical protein